MKTRHLFSGMATTTITAYFCELAYATILMACAFHALSDAFDFYSLVTATAPILTFVLILGFIDRFYAKISD